MTAWWQKRSDNEKLKKVKGSREQQQESLPFLNAVSFVCDVMAQSDVEEHSTPTEGLGNTVCIAHTDVTGYWSMPVTLIIHCHPLFILI